MKTGLQKKLQNFLVVIFSLPCMIYLCELFIPIWP